MYIGDAIAIAAQASIQIRPSIAAPGLNLCTIGERQRHEDGKETGGVEQRKESVGEDGPDKVWNEVISIQL